MNTAAKKALLVLVVLVVCAAFVIRRVGLPRGRHGLSPRQNSAQMPAPATAPAAGEVGAQLPAFTFRDLAGHEISTEQWRGKVVLIDLWATWCAPCKVEMPGYQNLQDRYGGRGLVVVGFALDGDADAVRKFAKTLGVRYSLALATPEVQEKLGGLLGLPTTILVDRQGVIRKKVIGFEYTEAFEKTLQEIL